MSENVDFVLASYEWGNRERRFPRDFWHPDGECVETRLTILTMLSTEATRL